MYRPAPRRQGFRARVRSRSGRQSVGPQCRSRAVGDEYQQPALGEAVEASHNDALGDAHGSGYVAGRGSGMRCDVREEHTVTAIAALQQVLTK